VNRTSRTPFLFIAIIGALLCLGAYEITFESFRGFNPDDADIKNDWIVAAALVDGANPYADLQGLSRAYADGGYRPSPVDPTFDGPTRSPRTPGAVLLSMPLLLIPFDQLPQATNLLSLALVVPLVAMIAWRLRAPWVTLAALVILPTVPMLWNLRFSNLSTLVGVLVVSAVLLTEDKDSIAGGVMLALAITLKAYPAILIALLVSRGRKRALVSTVATLAILNIPPLMLSSVTISDALDALGSAGARFGFLLSNISVSQLVTDWFGDLAGLVVFVTAALAASIWVVARRSTYSVDAMFLMSVATAVAPISWPHYVLVLYPLAVWILLDREVSLTSRAMLLLACVMTIPTTNITPTAIAVCLMGCTCALERFRLIRKMSLPSESIYETIRPNVAVT
jgi:Glycosyltransferase family 87